MEKIEITNSRTKELGLGLFALLLMPVFYLLIQERPAIRILDLTTSPYLSIALGMLGMLLCGLGGIALLKSSLEPEKTILILDKEGFTGKTAKPGRYAWADIASIDLIKVSGVLMISLNFKDTEVFLRQQSTLNQKIMRSNLKVVGAPVQVMTSGLKIKPAALYQQFSDYLDFYHEQAPFILNP